MANIRRTYGKYTANIKQIYSEWLADKRQTYGEHTADIQQTYNEHMGNMMRECIYMLERVITSLEGKYINIAMKD